MRSDGFRGNDCWGLNLFDLGCGDGDVAGADFGGENLLESLLASDFLDALEVLRIC